MTDRCEAWSFSIAGSLPGLNEYTAACRTNPHAGAKLKHGAQMVVTAYARCQKPPVRPSMRFSRTADSDLKARTTCASVGAFFMPPPGEGTEPPSAQVSRNTACT